MAAVPGGSLKNDSRKSHTSMSTRSDGRHAITVASDCANLGRRRRDVLPGWAADLAAERPHPRALLRLGEYEREAMAKVVILDTREVEGNRVCREVRSDQLPFPVEADGERDERPPGTVVASAGVCMLGSWPNPANEDSRQSINRVLGLRR
eukprot:1687907-Rhodomonas_salina.1